MARAKRTERADARHRYRAATAGAPDVDAAVETPVVPVAALPRERRDRRPSGLAPGAPPPPRAGFLGSLRAAAGPADLRGDLRAFPSVVLGSKAALIPGLVIVGTTAALVIPATAANPLVVLAGNVILQPPPMIIAFLAGMLAPRGAWLMGGLMGLLATAGYLVQYLVGADTLMTPLGFTVTLNPADKLAVGAGDIPSSLLSGLVFGLAVGAFSGFYRRFLNMSAPKRQAPQRQAPQRQATRRR